MANVTLTFSNITNNGKPCKDPIILITGADNVAFPCGDKVDENGQIKLTVPDSVFGERQCITGVIKCAECDACKEEDFKICLCDELNPCEACQECVNGICVDKCPDKKCVNGACCDCEVSSDCGNGYICNGCNCICPTGYKNAKGDCVACLTNAQCGPCEDCINGECVSKCAPGLICDGTECKCPPGTKYNITTGKCEKIDCASDKDCPECQVCVGGECVPIKCPEGTKCVNGECIPWPCDKPCNNGADCGEDCGCLDGQCIPCNLLDCTDEASPAFGRCIEVSGCKCSGNVCTGVDNCGEYCDEFTPCTTPGCTCYNNTCVSCENFSCEDSVGGCTSYVGCACDDAGNCGPGDPCTDTVTITKKEDCASQSCQLVAELKTNKCACDSIRFQTKNTTTCNQNSPSSNLNLKVELFKGTAAYANYKNEITIGDNEFVLGSIKTVVTHYDISNNIISSLQLTPVAAANITNNVVSPIEIKEGVNFSKQYATAQGAVGTKVVIELKAEGINVPNSGCIKYENAVIARYELDFRSAGSSVETCAKIGGEFALAKEAFVNDKVSSKKPLFIWSRGTTNFGTGKFDTATKTYNKGGWFKKVFGVPGPGGWTSTLSNVYDNETKFELISNYNYQVKVSCGCAVSATYNNLIFCCPTEFTPKVGNCGKTLEIPAFNTCPPNRNLSSFNNGVFPDEIQTYYKAVINDGEADVTLNSNGGNITTLFTYTHTKEIKNVKIKQFYKGTPLVKEACEKSYDFTSTLEDYNITVECGKIVVTPKAGFSAISGVSAKVVSTNAQVPFSKSGTTYTATSDLLKIRGKVEVTVNFTGSSCQRVDQYDINCEASAVINKTGKIYGECITNPAEGAVGCGKGVDVVVTALTGFTANCEFIDFTDNTKWLKPDTTTPAITKKYTLYPYSAFVGKVRELVNGTYIYADTQLVEVLSPIQLNVTSTPECNNEKSKIILTGKACDGSIVKDVIIPAGVKIEIKSVSTAWQQIVTADGVKTSYEVETQANLNPGVDRQFTVKILDTKGIMCNFNQTITVKDSSTALSPTIVIEGNNPCQWSVIPFAIRGADGYSFSITLDGGILVNQDGTAASNNIVTGVNQGPSGYIKITGNPSSVLVVSAQLSGNSPCITLSGAVQATKEFRSALDIFKFESECLGGRRVKFTVITVGTPNLYLQFSQVNSDYGAFMQDGINRNKWTLLVDDVNPLVDIKITIELNGTNDCRKYIEYDFPDCGGRDFCISDPVVNIVANPPSPTCSVGQNITLSFLNSNLGDVSGEQYTWYEVDGISDIPLNIPGEFNPGTIGSGNVIPPAQVSSTAQSKFYKLAIITNDGDCIYESETVEVVSGGGVDANIVGAGIAPNTTTIVPGSGYLYTAPLYNDGLYVWELTLPNGSTVNVGIGTGDNGGNQITVNQFQVGANFLKVTITRPNCTGTDTKTINVGLDCSSHRVALNSISNCSNITFTIDNPDASPITGYTWYINNVATSQTGVSPVLPFNTSIVEAGETVDVKLVVNFANGCPAEDTISYTRCNCICSGNTCNNFGNYRIGVYNLGYFSIGSQFTWGVRFFESRSTNHILKLDGVPIFETGFLTAASTGCATTGCNPSTQLVGDSPNNPNLTLTYGSSALGTWSGNAATAGLYTFGCDRIANTLAAPVNLGLLGTGVNSIQLQASGQLTLEVINGTCTSTNSASNRNEFYIKCGSTI